MTRKTRAAAAARVPMHRSSRIRSGSAALRRAGTRTGLLRGVEALARWQHPLLGMVPPDEFIPMAERMGLIHDLTRTMVEQSFAQCAAWQSRGMRLTLAIN
ncbi:EAL domain-containing protein, partial [Raoultella sp. 18093]|uniref:EAL domain-containing protein n=1 Tax=Raoultella sp. 18093 TaxID=2681425 RepID=UPI0013593A14